jgi:hypothetical protein
MTPDEEEVLRIIETHGFIPLPGGMLPREYQHLYRAIASLDQAGRIVKIKNGGGARWTSPAMQNWRG